MRPSVFLFTIPILFTIHCGRSDTPSPVDKALPSAISPFVLTTEPPGAVEIDALKKNVKTGDAVVAHGRFQDFNDVLASFKLVDASLPACGEEEGVADSCETPWDYCCEPDLGDHLVIVELRDHDGAPVSAALRGSGGFDYLGHAVVVGKAEVDDRGNVTIVASGVYLRS